MSRTAAFIIAVFLGAAPAVLQAEQASSFGDYTIHYSAFTTDILTPEVAKTYRIQRSKNRALLNVSVLKKVMGTTSQPVRAKVQASATNLSAQLRQLEVREVVEHGAIYYLAESPVEHEEILKYSLVVTPEGETTPLNVSFDQQFFTAE